MTQPTLFLDRLEVLAGLVSSNHRRALNDMEEAFHELDALYEDLEDAISRIRGELEGNK